MDAINAFEPKTFDRTAGILTGELSDEIITEVERLEQQPKQVNIGEFDISTCENLYLDELVAKFDLELPELDASSIEKVLSDCGNYESDTNFNRLASTCEQISSHRQESRFEAPQYLAVPSGELSAMTSQVKQPTEMFLELPEHVHISTETHQMNPQTFLNDRYPQQQTHVYKEQTPIIDVGARPYLWIEEINNVSGIERLLLYDSSQTKDVREIEFEIRNVTSLTEEFNERSVIITRSEDVTLDIEQQHTSQEVPSSAHTLPAALYQEDYFNQSPLSDSGQSDLGIENVQPLSEKCDERSVIITRTKDDVEHHPESEELVSLPHPTPLCQEGSLQTKQVRCGQKIKNIGNPSKRESKTHFCKECNKGFSSRCNLNVHVRIHTGEKPFKCGDCDASFSRKEYFTKHQRMHTGEKPFKCADCDVSFSHKTSLNTHQRIHTGEKPFKCADCDVAFSYKISLTTHQKIHTGEKPFKCGVCGVAFRQKPQLTAHQRIHTGEKPFKCGNCDVAFSHKGSLTVHRRIHTGEKPFKCGDCGVAFRQKPQLTVHQRIHTGEEPFKCGDCDVTFSRKDGLTAHQRIHTGEKPFKCGVCDVAFSHKTSLNTHQRIHTGEKPFECGYCHVTFTRKDALTAHQRIHTGEKPFKCADCDVSFCQKGSLTAHQRIHTV